MCNFNRMHKLKVIEFKYIEPLVNYNLISGCR